MIKVTEGFELEHKPIENIGPLDHFVKVNYVLRGCPVDGNQASRLLELLVEEKKIVQGEKSFDYAKPRYGGNNEGRAIVLDNEKCILCERCIEICDGIASALSIAKRGINTLISPPFRMNIEGSTCISCGQCTVNCPVSAIYEKDSISEVNAMLSSGKPVDAVVEVETAVSIGEFFGLNERCHGILVDALKRIGFRNVYLSRSKYRAKFLSPKPLGKFPAIIPCSYSARKFVETFYPTLRQALAQPPKPSFKAEVWIGPCTGRKIDSGMIVLTTREVSRMIRDYMTMKCLEFNEFEDFNFDDVELREPEAEKRVVAEGALEMRQVLDKAVRGELQGSVVELWACPGGCNEGGGQYRASEEIVARRKEWSDSIGSALWRTRWWART
ncbi:MAG: [Fe-Fe] hydrogenase large subunit C-terminal domain-containing protein [Thermoproteota archaeon]